MEPFDKLVGNYANELFVLYLDSHSFLELSLHVCTWAFALQDTH